MFGRARPSRGCFTARDSKWQPPTSSHLLQSSSKRPRVCTEIFRSQKTVHTRQRCDLVFWNSCFSWQGQSYESSTWCGFSWPAKRWDIWIQMGKLESSICPFQINKKQGQGWLYHQEWYNQKPFNILLIACSVRGEWSSTINRQPEPSCDSSLFSHWWYEH